MQLEIWHHHDGLTIHKYWLIPDSGTKIWCTAWDERIKTIFPCVDGLHVLVDGEVFHKDELMSMLESYTRRGLSWSLEGVKCKERRKFNGKWVLE